MIAQAMAWFYARGWRTVLLGAAALAVVLAIVYVRQSYAHAIRQAELARDAAVRAETLRERAVRDAADLRALVDRQRDALDAATRALEDAARADARRAADRTAQMDRIRDADPSLAACLALRLPADLLQQLP